MPANVLTTHPPITLHANTNKNLPVTYTVSGSATLSNDSILTLIGDTGTVTVTAHQPGNTTIAAATDLPMSFKVINPLYIFPKLEIKNPVDATVVRSPHLDPIPLSLATSIDYNDILYVSNVYFTINSQIIHPDSLNNGYYLKYWTPPAYGTYTISATAVSSGGTQTTKLVTFQVVNDSSFMNYTLLNAMHFADFSNHILDTTMNLPSFSGTYKKITAYLQYDCPPEGCEPWDVIGSVNIRGANGEWIELLRYITPYALACHDSLDVTDFVSQLQGKVDVRCDFPSKSKVTIILKYYEGTPTYKYSWVEKLWLGSYGFGNWGIGTTNGYPTQQPVEQKNLKLSNPTITAAYLRLVTTGHGFGADYQGNAAEFYNVIHNININNNPVFYQNLWRSCNPNPTGCNGQNGTWQYSRAGWCPGSIPMLWEINLSASLGSNVNLNYEFEPTYLNPCSSANPNCVTGVTCSSCAGGTKPNYMVAGELITFFGGVPAYNNIEEISDNFNLNLYPNPSNGLYNLSTGKKLNTETKVEVFNISGVLLKEFKWNGEPTKLDISDFPKGIYLLKVSNLNAIEYKKLIIQ